MGSYIQTEEIDENDYLDEMDFEVIEFIKNLEKSSAEKMPEPSAYRVATHTTTCFMGNKDMLDCELYLDIGEIIRYITRRVIEDNFLNPVETPLFQGIVTDHINIRFDDDMFRKKKYKPNSVLVTKMIEGSDKPLIQEYFDEKDVEGTKERLQELIENHTCHYIQKNGRQKREKKKKSDFEDYQKKSVVTTYNMYEPKEEESGKMKSEIHIIENDEKSVEKSAKSRAEPKEYEHMYNSCSIIIKPSKTIKAVNISLFSNAQMTISGNKEHYDGLVSAKALLDEFRAHSGIIKGVKRLDKDAPTESARRKNKIMYPVPSEEYIQTLEILKYSITLINANFHTNYNIDLKELNRQLVEHEEDLFIVYDPEKHRGVQINYFWNKKIDARTIDSPESCQLHQDGVCRCVKACSAKKVRKKSYSSFEIKNSMNNYDTCTKVKICIFKSGSIGLIGGTDPKHTEDAYHFVNYLLAKYYKSIVKVSLDDYLKEKREKKDEVIMDVIKSCDTQLGLGLQWKEEETKEKVVKKKSSSKSKKVKEEKTSPPQKEESTVVQSTLIIKDLPKPTMKCKLLTKKA